MLSLLLVLVSRGVLVLGQLQEVEQQCQDQAKCVFKYNCPAFTKAEDILDSLLRGSYERNMLLSLMTGSVCNKAARGVCCPEDPCNLGQTCVAQDQCQEFQQLSQKLRTYDKDSPERSALLTQLKDRICDKNTRAVCCEIITGTAALTSTVSCDLSDDSCLPASGECGLSGGEQRIGSIFDARVVGGDDTIPGEFPYTALLGVGQSNQVKEWICGGTLINRRYVVTAGHCRYNRQGQHISVVRLGEYQVTDNKQRDCVNPGNCLPEPQDFPIQPVDVTVHPQYEDIGAGGVIFDIALIRLPSLVNLNAGVSVVCLPIDPVIAAAQLNVPDIREGLAGFYTTVVGWGYTDPYDRQLVGDRERIANSVQQKLAVPVLTKEACTRSLGIVRKFTLRENMICAGGESGKDSCGGDSGGPLFLKHIIEGQKLSALHSTDRKDSWYLLGIVSFGTRTCGIGTPAIYTRVESFIPWIQSEIKKCDLSNSSCLPALGECGLSRRIGRIGKIVGGEDTRPGEFPYNALLGKTMQETGQSYPVTTWFCGGTLINRRYVVTAGHCQDTRPGKHISVVRLGEYQVTDNKQRDCVNPSQCLPERQDFSIQADDITVHPQYENTKTGPMFNIALIRLPRLVNLNAGVSVVCLPIDPIIAAAQLNVPDIREGLAGFYTTVVGWGHTDPYDRELVGVSERVPSSMQQKLAVPVLTTEACTKSLGSILRGFTLKENMICAGGESGKDSCLGDSGGPLYLKHSTDSKKPWYLLGIVSFGTSTCASGKPTGYTRVESFIPWIRSVIKK